MTDEGTGALPDWVAELAEDAVARAGDHLPAAAREGFRRAVVEALDARLGLSSPAAPGPGSPVDVDYVNHEDKRSTRTFMPTGRFVPGGNQWHPGTPWLIEAVDVGRGVTRTLDPARVKGWWPCGARRDVGGPGGGTE